MKIIKKVDKKKIMQFMKKEARKNLLYVIQKNVLVVEFLMVNF